MWERTSIAIDDTARKNLIPFRSDNPIAMIDMNYDASGTNFSVNFRRPAPSALALYLVEYAPFRTAGIPIGLTLLGYAIGRFTERHK